ncbi:hypothetical protein [Streptomyces sp. NPDC088246]|uniref:hypothetical protein n=1 Tax=Streptomyces sp. NPDC088246 TaxID=3365842 RepID=UPI0037F310FD
MAREDVDTEFHLFTNSTLGETVVAEEALGEAGVAGRQVHAQGNVPLGDIVISGAASLTALTHAIVTLRRQFKRGIMIDALGSEGLVIKSDGTLPRGLLVIRNADGQVEVRDAEGLSETLAGALSGRGQAPQQPSPQVSGTPNA